MQTTNLKSQEKENNIKDTSVNIEKMFEVGAHYGYGKSRRHPSVSSYIYATKNSSDIIDLEKTSTMLKDALEFVKNLGAQGKTILFVGSKPEARDIIKNSALSLDMPYVDIRWIGGTLSNFTEIKKRIAELEKYNKENTEGGLEKYTKKERVVMAKKMEKLTKFYGGLIGLKKTPDALFIIDSKAEHIAATEARKSNVPVVALANSDSNIKGIDYPIVANDSGIPSIKLFTTYIINAYNEGSKSLAVKEK
ncbi:MAG: 30S ribosomal protein S2 [Candidatus Nomurabacteria bacterium GW2011_GWE1_32_28]|uniref:Small ribosomal subunit protein uS2 n=1 Tax=Candidatus Nomurabacteria bacterium GW2011_GWF1_31_48 TaxID=1618767 RepID=A0A0F9YEV2_9BACT|nr:MAG: 30S ribosomal protein S2 [Candidatus Nomurabacteria bacterium GW2011_GWF2_30_133]KKP28603.1 MAG: 30S ribosomal protein S2 [Candidatus Nomurabacteria bacterium GW2011_GWE2_31_40]KKP30179.1 MAG: 30S ribosomal protein S2 [Candidatus Nomurabacteria bacterium GW2011_GWF1_31_48]KKP34705.1 MAG: 30S ribosomal protein S2 [Candidatus Nomurabacteria bacterium GW2011_GWE1_32_28]HAS80836.1 30S ribosomal protein S2 [Candidatus Nomurabacteria bacterium]